MKSPLWSFCGDAMPQSDGTLPPQEQFCGVSNYIESVTPWHLFVVSGETRDISFEVWGGGGVATIGQMNQSWKERRAHNVLEHAVSPWQWSSNPWEIATKSVTAAKSLITRSLSQSTFFFFGGGGGGEGMGVSTGRVNSIILGMTTGHRETIHDYSQEVIAALWCWWSFTVVSFFY